MGQILDTATSARRRLPRGHLRGSLHYWCFSSSL